ncbi:MULTISPECIES: baseplate J/gp47 family protein [unclassified Archaeoglobus]|jgi:uncharacterized phage protein gp47/JayE|uniref:baseplate J/gp47 family protein n=1 Tax=unclassified Archaeoglobus TaxID=2643606 RepID=UPI0025C4AAC3|nr:MULTISPECIES: baseplate J/gp47 family protein [unclassified Archaeoglobus]
MNYGVTDYGFVVKPFNAILDGLKQRAKLYLGEIDLSEDSEFLAFLKTIAYDIDMLWQLLEDAYYAGYIEFATGQNLDRLVAILGIRRKQATKATGIVTFSRSTPATSNIVIPIGTKVATADGSVIFQTIEEVILQQGQTSVDAAIEAVEPGSHGNVAENTITKLLDPISGIESVNNASPTSGGSDAESDEELRYRAITYAPSAKATVYSIKAALLQVEGVTDVNVEEDFAECKVTVTIAGGNDADITNTIEDVRPAGIQVIWQRPSIKTITVTVSVTKIASYDAATVQANVQAAIDNYINSLPIGEDVVYSDLAKAILAAEGVDDINSLEATDGVTTINAFGQALTIEANEKAQAGAHEITVT